MSCEEERNLLQMKELYQEAINILEEILRDVKFTKTGTEIGRGAGIGFGIVGTGVLVVGLLSIFVPPLAPIAPILGWVGFGVGVAGGGTVAGSKIAKQILNKNFIANWKVMENAISKAAKRSEDSFLAIEKVVKNLEEKHGNNREASVKYIVTCLKNGEEWKHLELNVLSEKINHFTNFQRGAVKLNKNATFEGTL